MQVKEVKLISLKFIVRLFHGKEKPSEMCPIPNVCLPSSLGSRAQLVHVHASGRHWFKSQQTLNFFAGFFSIITAHPLHSMLYL